jgi:hypothetical protein
MMVLFYRARSITPPIQIGNTGPLHIIHVGLTLKRLDCEKLPCNLDQVTSVYNYFTIMILKAVNRFQKGSNCFPKRQNTLRIIFQTLYVTMHTIDFHHMLSCCHMQAPVPAPTAEWNITPLAHSWSFSYMYCIVFSRNKLNLNPFHLSYTSTVTQNGCRWADLISPLKSSHPGFEKSSILLARFLVYCTSDQVTACWCIWKSFGVNACLHEEMYFHFIVEVFLYSFL